MLLLFEILPIIDLLGLDWLKDNFGSLLVLLIVFGILYKFLYSDNTQKQKAIIEKDKALLSENGERISYLENLLREERDVNKENNNYIRELNSQSLETLGGISNFLNTLIEKVGENKDTMKETVTREAAATRDIILQMRHSIEERKNKE